MIYSQGQGQGMERYISLSCDYHVIAVGGCVVVCCAVLSLSCDCHVIVM